MFQGSRKAWFPFWLIRNSFPHLPPSSSSLNPTLSSRPQKGKKAQVRALPPPQGTNLLSGSPRFSLPKDEGLSDPCSFLLTSGHPVAATLSPKEIVLLLVPVLPTEWAKTGTPIRVVGDGQAGSTDFLQLQRWYYCPVCHGGGRCTHPPHPKAVISRDDTHRAGVVTPKIRAWTIIVHTRHPGPEVLAAPPTHCEEAPAGVTMKPQVGGALGGALGTQLHRQSSSSSSCGFHRDPTNPLNESRPTLLFPGSSSVNPALVLS